MLSDFEMVEALEYGIAVLKEDCQNNVAAMEKEIADIQSACTHDFKLDKEHGEFYVCTKCKSRHPCRI